MLSSINCSINPVDQIIQDRVTGLVKFTISIYSKILSGLYTSFFSNSRSCCVAGADTLTFIFTFGAFILIFHFREVTPTAHIS
jgi:hypothetical protein